MRSRTRRSIALARGFDAAITRLLTAYAPVAACGRCTGVDRGRAFCTWTYETVRASPQKRAIVIARSCRVIAQRRARRARVKPQCERGRRAQIGVGVLVAIAIAIGGGAIASRSSPACYSRLLPAPRSPRAAGQQRTP
jgi:hypothetical protein